MGGVKWFSVEWSSGTEPVWGRLYGGIEVLCV